MSKQYDGINQYSAVAACPLADYPVILACWFYVTSAQDATLIGVFDDSVLDQWLRLQITSGQRVLASARNGAAGFAASTGTYNLNAWNWACAEFDSDSFRQVYLNAVSGGMDFTNIGFPNLNSTAFGRRNNSNPLEYLNGRIAEAAFWNRWGDNRPAQLYRGRSPRLVDPAALVAYWPLIHTSVAKCRIAFGDPAYELSDVNGPVNAEHPRIVYGVKPLTTHVAMSAAKAQARHYWHNLSARPDKDFLPVL